MKDFISEKLQGFDYTIQGSHVSLRVNDETTITFAPKDENEIDKVLAHFGVSKDNSFDEVNQFEE